MSDQPISPKLTEVDLLMQQMSLHPNLPLAPDPTPAQPTGSPSSLRDVRIQRVMDKYGVTHEEAVQMLADFGF